MLGEGQQASRKGRQRQRMDARSDDPLHTLESREMGKRLQEALQQLPEKQRMAIIMFTIEEMPQKQVAEALDCSGGSGEVARVSRRKKLKRC